MPVYDRKCSACDWTRPDCYEPVTFSRDCPECGKPTERVWAAPAMHGDDRFIGGMTLENIDHHPVTVHSRSELKRELNKRGLREFVRHAPMPGTDKSKHTSRWT